MSGQPKNSNQALQATLAVSSVIFALFYVGYRGLLIDEIFVAIRYGANFARGHGLVFDPTIAGPACPDPLNAKLAAAGVALGLDPLVVLQVATAIGAAAYLWATAWLARTIGAGTDWTLACSLVLPLPAFAYWSAVPADVVWLGALIAAANAAAISEMRIAGMPLAGPLFLLAVLQRPVLVVAFLASALAFPRNNSASADRRSWTIGAVLGVLMLYLGARWAIYGATLLPAVFDPSQRAVEVMRMLMATRSWLAQQPLLAAALLFPLAQLFLSRREVEPARARLNLIYWTATGAVAAAIFAARVDPYPAAFLWAAPLLAVLLSGAAAMTRVPAAILCAGILAQAGWGSIIAHSTKPELVGADERVREARDIGAWMREALPAGATTATDYPGTIGYASDRPTLGLSDGLAGRSNQPSLPAPRNDSEAALQQQPRFVILIDSLRSNTTRTPRAEALEDNFIFRFFYEQKKAPLPGHLDHNISYFEIDPRDIELWPKAWAARDVDIDPFLDEAVRHWTRDPIAPLDDALRSELEHLNQAGLEASERQDLDGALALFEEARRKAPDGIGLAALARNGGFVEVRRRNLHGAVRWFKDLMRIAPEDPMSRRHLRMVLLSSRRLLFNNSDSTPQP